ncbi:methyltransferase domain-containing protein [Psychrosphaera sp. 1_MG-2023]|uniref:methyltransferase domain-containing protein n=1 Tax=Psychrosphaera sp. 1_MG-2023 TaxID=3062643 RepID=UPI0026E44FFE|nr:methyltransferase domain-containing protein [Psychrosphaera sp. 1_MG-2023]MDO6717911.1 methyltransferase domain-containing protein [Psychrosphaera sp. 1_MG-2023]
MTKQFESQLIAQDTFQQLSQREKIQICFSNSAQTYRCGAQLQQRVGQTCLSKIANKKYKRILDLGCGPGLFAPELELLTTQLISLDLSKSMLETNPSSGVKIQSDSHKLPLQPNCFDLVFSSLMIQWCNIETVLSEIHQILRPGGQAVISTLVSGTLIELEQAWSAVDNDTHIHQYSTFEDIERIVNSSDWKKTNAELATISLKFDSVLSLAKELKLLGANFVKDRKNKGLVTKNKWVKMEQAYQHNCGSDNSIPATYQVVYITLEK